ncbi:BED-type domain-containing protein [Citrus sinensis]|uniref:BED-type domain-containing protein n=1 Tax=Citrus sinensis TaxID=2711 RepID=A0ACB8IP08_CITSI|nr:BED-type domain-containing protein [Citrus sinensis]
MSNSCEDSYVGEENRNDDIPVEGVQEVEGVEEASRGDDGVQQSNRRISVVTLDNCSTNDAMVDRLMGLIPVDSMLMGGDFFHKRCMAHILNLIVKEGMKVIEEWIKKIRDSVVYWTGTPKRVETFEMAARQLQVKCEKKLILDCVTRWNSAYIMLDVAVKYNTVFFRLQQRDKHYTSLPTDEEWEMPEKMLEYLMPFYSTTELFSSKNGNVSDAVVGESSSIDVRFNFNVGTGLKFFDISKFEAFASQNSEIIVLKSDLERYLEEPLIKSTPDFDILNWWKVNQGKYPILAQMAKDILVVPMTTVGSESAFSTGGKILESEIFSGDEFVDEDESGPQVLE